MMDAFEVAGKILHLPALVRAYLLALDAAAWAGPFSRAQLVNLGGYRKIFEVGKIPPSFATLHASKFFLRFTARWKIIRIYRLPIHLLREVQKHLRQIAGGLQTISARTVVPLAISVQLQLQPQIFNVKIVSPPGLLFGTLSFAIALFQHRAQQCL